MTKRILTVSITITLWIAGASGAALASGQTQVENLQALGATSPWVSESGTASYYGSAHQGRRAASGIRFDQMALTAAHPWLPFGTRVKVILADTGRSVIVTITDRLYSNRRIVDLSLAAARQLGMIRLGIAEVTLLPT